MNAILDPLGYEFFVRAIVASALVGVVCAVVGTYMVLRGLAFMGDALSHSAFPGVVIAYLLQAPFYLGAAIAAVITSLAIGWVSRRGGLRNDTVIGVLFAGHVLARHLPVQRDPELRGRPLRLPLRPGARDRDRRSRGAGRARRNRPGDRAPLLEGVPVRNLRPARRGRVGPAGRPPRLPVPRPHRAHDRRQPPGRRHHPGGRDARDAGGNRPAASRCASTGSCWSRS